MDRKSVDLFANQNMNATIVKFCLNHTWLRVNMTKPTGTVECREVVVQRRHWTFHRHIGRPAAGPRQHSTMWPSSVCWQDARETWRKTWAGKTHLWTQQDNDKLHRETICLSFCFCLSVCVYLSLMVRAQCQSARMSIITNDGLTRSGTYRMVYSCTHMATVGVKGLKTQLT